jgi:hypothetical protein
MSDEERHCTICQKPFPATAEFFHRKQGGDLRGECKACRNKKGQDEASKEKDDRLDDIEKGAVEHFIVAARRGGGNVPHTRELLETGMEYFGGVRGFMNIFMKNLYDAPSGGAYRTKMLMAWLGLVTANTSLGGATKPLEAMTEEELEAEIRRTMKLEMANLAKGLVVEGQVALPMPDSIPTPEELSRGQEEASEASPAADDPED